MRTFDELTTLDWLALHAAVVNYQIRMGDRDWPRQREALKKFQAVLRDVCEHLKLMDEYTSGLPVDLLEGYAQVRADLEKAGYGHVELEDALRRHGHLPPKEKEE
jgi:hypothetical protein